MGESDNKRKDGETILNNYKKQLAEKMAREKFERGDSLSSSSTSSRMGGKKGDYGSGGGGGNEPLEPEILQSILEDKNIFDRKQ